MPNEEEIKKEIEVKLDEPLSEKEIEIKPNALETLTQAFDKEEETKAEQPKVVPPYSDDLPYSEKVRKRIQKEVAKRAEAEQRIAELEDRLATMEKKTIDIASKSLSNQYSSISQKLKQAIEEGNTEEQIKLYESMADIRSQMNKTQEYASEIPKKTDPKKPIPPLASDWVKENSNWFNKPGYRKETAMAYGIDAELTEEGWDVNDPEYYNEMTRRLKASNLPYFSKSEESASQTDKNVVQKANRVQSPVAGVSRKKGIDSNRVKLTSEDLDTARKFGIDINDEAALKRFAKEVKSFSDTGQL
jgi:uncharacterized coiled-coil protein SlyX